MIILITAILLLAASMAGMIYQLAAAREVSRFTARKALPTPAPEPVTILKPLCGAEPDLLDNLRSFWCQPWPDLRMVCGVADADDPAATVVRRLQMDFPEGDIRLVMGAGKATNAKIANLLSMMTEAGPGILVLADSDMRAGPGYLPAVVSTLAQPGVGIATCLYVGHSASDWWSRLGALGINGNFLPSALMARALGRGDGCFGATMALRRDTLDRLGGFAICADHLADDYALGQAVRRLGLTIALAPVLVQAQVHEAGLAGLAAHEIRWGRTIASLAPYSYAGSIITHPVMLALLGALLVDLNGLAFLAAALIVRLSAIRRIEHALGLAPVPLWLVPLRDVLSFTLFIAAFTGRSVRWHGRRYRIIRDGTLEAGS